ncbi:MAG: hypothetical protein IT170_04060 [Bryobacterales bacterium]|nr:hypothetical protein [Bryobacterales bacterium]
MCLRIFISVLMLVVSPAAWAGVVCMADGHTAIEVPAAACCLPAAGHGGAQLEAGDCGPCMDIPISSDATFERGGTRSANPHHTASPDAALLPAAAAPCPAEPLAGSMRPYPAALSLTPPLLSPLRC